VLGNTPSECGAYTDAEQGLQNLCVWHCSGFALGWFSKAFINIQEAHAQRALLSSGKAIQKKCVLERLDFW
jgi:hypothetical protein